jgi:subtilisin family serine protease
MNRFHVLAHNDPLYPLQPTAKSWQLSEVHKLTTGRNVRVAEVDSGVEMLHPDLIGRVSVTRNFVDDRADVGEVHGTAIAGIIAARADDGVGIAGIAPESRLIALRACWQATGSGDVAICSSFTLAKALQFALEEKAQVINLSLGGPRDRLLERLLDVALSRGITVVAAADPAIRDGGFPASHRGVLAVLGEDANDVSEAILLGPARDIPTTLTGKKWGFVTGSSFAAAHVAGLAALLRELAPALPAAQMREALAPRGMSNVAGRRVVVDACAAVARVGRVCACACAVAGTATSMSPPP